MHDDERSIRDPSSNIKLLFVTPEKVAKSDALLRALDQLYTAGRLARIVVDEAHCGERRGMPKGGGVERNVVLSAFI